MRLGAKIYITLKYIGLIIVYDEAYHNHWSWCRRNRCGTEAEIARGAISHS